MHFSYLQNMVASVRKDSVTKTFDDGVEQFTDLVDGPVSTFAELVDSKKLAITGIDNLEVMFARGNPGYKKVRDTLPILAHVSSKLRNIEANFKYLGSVTVDELGAVVTNTGLTTRTAFMLRGAEHISFLVDFTETLLKHQTYQVTQSNKGKFNVPADSALVPLEPIKLRLLGNMMSDYALLIAAYSIDPNDFRDKVMSIPEIFINEGSLPIIDGYGPDEINPVENDNGVLGFKGSPILWVRMEFTRWQTTRFKEKEAKKRELELRILYLESQLHGSSDANLEKQLEYNRKRAADLEYEMIQIRGN